MRSGPGSAGRLRCAPVCINNDEEMFKSNTNHQKCQRNSHEYEDQWLKNDAWDSINQAAKTLAPKDVPCEENSNIAKDSDKTYDSWKKDGIANGWNNEDDIFDGSQANLQNLPNYDKCQDFLIKKLGLNFKSIFLGKKILTKNTNNRRL